jgi:hypothetical protein
VKRISTILTLFASSSASAIVLAIVSLLGMGGLGERGEFPVVPCDYMGAHWLRPLPKWVFFGNRLEY